MVTEAGRPPEKALRDPVAIQQSVTGVLFAECWADMVADLALVRYFKSGMMYTRLVSAEDEVETTQSSVSSHAS